MYRVDVGGSSWRCDGVTRRSFVQIGVAGMASFGLPQILRAKQASAAAGIASRDTSTILIWLDGGPSHLDTYDMKPEAAAEYRGIWKPISTNVSGIEVTELFPLQAKLADKFSLVRSIHHDSGDHFTGGHYMLTGRGGVNGGRKAPKFPSVGSIATKFTGPRTSGFPPYVSVPVASSIGLRPGYFGGHFLSSFHDPFQPGGDPNADNFSVKKFSPPGDISIDQLDDRQELRRVIDGFHRDVEHSGAYEVMDEYKREAYDMVSSGAVSKAFQISDEDTKLREQYGRNGWGQSTLLARRLVEAGSTFVTVHYGGWDHHWNLEGDYKDVLPRVDMAVSALIEDLCQRGLLEKVLVLVVGEFGRTPKMNNGHNGKGTPGRDHWGRALSCLVAGGGTRGGRVIGATNPRGEHPVERPLSPSDLHATIYHVLGLDPQFRFLDQNDRPVAAVDDGHVIEELF